VLAAVQGNPVALAVNSSAVYWAYEAGPDAVNENQNPALGGIMMVSPCGGTPVSFASDQDGPNSIALGATQAFWVSNGPASIMDAPLVGVCSARDNEHFARA
jgi:hypothetical protein